MPLGYDRYARRVVYDNKEFLLNAVNYLFKRTPDQCAFALHCASCLDEDRIRAERSGWHFVAVGIPLLVVILWPERVDHASTVVWSCC